MRSDGEDGSVVAIVDETVDAAIERMADPTGALVCTEAALRGWRSARYPNPKRMLDALRRLESAAIEWRTNDAEIGERLGDWIQNTTGLRYAGSDQELERRGLATFHFEGRKMSRIPHIKVDDGKHSNQVGRIYFAIDSQVGGGSSTTLARSSTDADPRGSRSGSAGTLMPGVARSQTRVLPPPSGVALGRWREKVRGLSLVGEIRAPHRTRSLRMRECGHGPERCTPRRGPTDGSPSLPRRSPARLCGALAQPTSSRRSCGS